MATGDTSIELGIPGSIIPCGSRRTHRCRCNRWCRDGVNSCVYVALDNRYPKFNNTKADLGKT